MKAIVLVIENADEAETVSRLIAATLSMNGYRHDAPAVIDWPTTTGQSTSFTASTRENT